jgi:hypothetical protein
MTVKIGVYHRKLKAISRIVTQLGLASDSRICLRANAQVPSKLIALAKTKRYKTFEARTLSAKTLDQRGDLLGLVVMQHMPRLANFGLAPISKR